MSEAMHSSHKLSMRNEILRTWNLRRKQKLLYRQMAIAQLRELPSCVLCRKKRRKCDMKPTCGHCLRNAEECLYPDTLLGISRFDLDGKRRRRALVTGANEEAELRDDRFGFAIVDTFGLQMSSYEAVLQWPLLRDLNVEGPVESFTLQASHMQSPANAPSQCQDPPRLKQYRIVELCEIYLRNIHMRNPIIEVSKFRQYAREAEEHGPGWDGPGCFVLLACALAKLCWPSFADSIVERATGPDVLFDNESVLYLEIGESEAEKYFQEAQRRIVCLPDSLITIQCVYLMGLYYQFALRSVDAWHCFKGACIRFQALLRPDTTPPKVPIYEGNADMDIQRCVYWLCARAEYELRAEWQIPATSNFQSPESKYPEHADLDVDGLFDKLTPCGHDDARPLCTLNYHGDDTLLREIKISVIRNVYGRGRAIWSTELTKTMTRCAAYCEQLDTWRRDYSPCLELPSPVSNAWTIPDTMDDKYLLLLQISYLCINELLHRPFIYCVLYRGRDLELVDHPFLLSLAQQCFEANCTLIRLIAAADFRYEGTWSLVRRSFGSSLIVLAAVRYNHCFRDLEDGKYPPIEVPQDWRGIMQMSIDTIRRWERPGVKDLPWMRRTLEHMVEVVEK